MLEYNEIVPKKFIVLNNEPYEVLSSWVFQKQQRRPTNQTKLRNLISGRVVEQSFRQSEKAIEADIESKDAKYLYTGRGESWFCDPKNPADRYAIKTELLEGKEGFLKANTIVTALVFDEKIIGVRVPIKVELLVKEAPPTVKGNTVQGGSKEVTLETGAKIHTPMFINEGDLIEINTETKEYAGRAEKK